MAQGASVRHQYWRIYEIDLPVMCALPNDKEIAYKYLLGGNINTLKKRRQPTEPS
jgi:hypothetical protein